MSCTGLLDDEVEEVLLGLLEVVGDFGVLEKNSVMDIWFISVGFGFGMGRGFGAFGGSYINCICFGTFGGE